MLFRAKKQRRLETYALCDIVEALLVDHDTFVKHNNSFFVGIAIYQELNSLNTGSSSSEGPLWYFVIEIYFGEEHELY